MPRKEKKRTPREHCPGPYTQPSTSTLSAATAKLKKTSRENLTLQDWLDVFQFIDTHPGMSQGNIVKYFTTHPDHPLKFNQSTLSRKVKSRADLEERANSTPTALKSKRKRIVTRPDVERALVKRFQHMKKRGETISGPMLMEKRRRFEERFEVPDSERLKGKAPQVEEAETELMTAVRSLKDRNRIHGLVLSVDEIVESPDEVDPEEEELPIDDDSIVDAVRKEMVAGKEIVEIDDEEMDEEKEPVKINYAELPLLCEQLEAACMSHLDKSFCFDLLTNLRRFRGLIRSEQIRSAKQTTLDTFFRPL